MADSRGRRREAPADDPLTVRGDERATLTGSLDWYRGVVEHKLTGLSLEQATRVMTPSGLSMAGIVKHLAWVERGWFQETFAGKIDDDRVPNPESFRVDANDTVGSITAEYRAACDCSRLIVADASSLDALAAREKPIFGMVSLRWILVHMLEETARHAGHLDIVREALDGRTGD